MKRFIYKNEKFFSFLAKKWWKRESYKMVYIGKRTKVSHENQLLFFFSHSFCCWVFQQNTFFSRFVVKSFNLKTEKLCEIYFYEITEKCLYVHIKSLSFILYIMKWKSRVQVDTLEVIWNIVMSFYSKGWEIENLC